MGRRCDTSNALEVFNLGDRHIECAITSDEPMPTSGSFETILGAQLSKSFLLAALLVDPGDIGLQGPCRRGTGENRILSDPGLTR